MDTPTRLAALAVVALLLGGAVALVLQGLRTDGGDAGAYPVRVTGPDGEMHNGTVPLPAGATALDALLAAAEDGGFEVHVRRLPGYEPCDRYVHRVGDHGEGDAGGGGAGWVYEVLRDGAWQRPVVGACAFPLRSGDQLWWRYTEGP